MVLVLGLGEALGLPLVQVLPHLAQVLMQGQVLLAAAWA
jgi:hypothetical protein